MKKSVLTVVFFVVAFLLGGELIAQCPMCRMSLESNLEAGGTAGKSINAGILYMLAVPYLLVFTIGYIWMKRNKRPGDLIRDKRQTIPMT